MKILVTGGAGFIGRHLVEFLSQNNIVLVYDNLSNSTNENAASLVKKGAKFLKGDILDVESLYEFAKGVDVVIHLAAKSDVSDSMKNPEITNKVNVDGTANVLQCCVRNKIKKIIFASSAAVYGDCDNIITEKTLTNPLSPYGQSKLDAEKIIIKTCQENNISHIIFRMFNVYGKGQNKQYAGVITKFFKNISENKPLVIYGDGKQTRDFISIHDIVKAYDCATKLDKVGIYNIASGKSITINELSKDILSSLNKKIEIKHTEEQRGGIQTSQADITLAKKELGFFPTKLLKQELSSIYLELD